MIENQRHISRTNFHHEGHEGFFTKATKRRVDSFRLVFTVNLAQPRKSIEKSGQLYALWPL